VRYYCILLSILFTSFVFSCKRKSETINTDPQAKLSFSSSQITFDTVFTSIGSVTKRLWVYNTQKHALQISTIHMAASGSPYSLIIGGKETNEVSDFVLQGKDSMLVMVKVNIDPQNQSLPYLVKDSIVFLTNGNIQDVDLIAYGQDAHFLTNETIACNAVWQNTKPYIVYGNARVAPGCTLTIEKGVRIFFHTGATMQVEGTLLTNGEKDSLVVFRHDNLSGYYQNIPGQWGGLVFETGSTENRLRYTEIRNATNALVLQPQPDADTIAEVRLENVLILNCSQNGITTKGSDLYAVNTLVANCAGYIWETTSGGHYYADFCTFANFSHDFYREKEAIRVSNAGTYSSALEMKWQNVILWGDKTEEISIEDNTLSGFDFTADYCILKTKQTLGGNNSLVNTNPLFENALGKNFRLQVASPAINSGLALPGVTADLEGNMRDAIPDRGCYEKQ
jgi:hypothetical protein